MNSTRLFRLWRITAVLAGTMAILAISRPVQAQISEDDRQVAADLIEQSGVQGGFIVQIGCRRPGVTAALRANERYQVHALDRDRSLVDTAPRSRPARLPGVR